MRTAQLDLLDNVAVTPSGRGSVLNRTQVADPVWRGTFDTWTLVQRPRAEWGAWKDSLGGGLRTFLASDSRKRAPLAYADAISANDIAEGWDGTAVVEDLEDGGVLTLSGLPAYYEITAGDRIGLEEGSPTRYGYYSIIEGAAADEAGDVVVTVSPSLHRAIFTTAAVARLWRPVCELVIDAQSWQDQPGELPSIGTISFQAFQKL